MTRSHRMPHRAAAVLLSVTTVAVTGASAVAFGAAGTTIYASPTGNDANPGSQSQPVRSLSHARDLARVADHGSDITIQLAQGMYRLSAPLALDQRDSGGSGHRVVWTAASGAHPVVSGGVRVTGWSVADAARGVWSAPAPTGLTNTRQLYVDGVRAQRARGVAPVSLTATATGYTASKATMASWHDPSQIEFVYTGGDGLWSTWYGLGPWTEARCPVGSMSGTTITMAQPCWDNSTKRPLDPNHPSRSVGEVGPGDLHAGRQPAYVENALELLDQPGEWYLDRLAHRVYYKPRPGERVGTADVEAPVLETLLSGAGTANSPIRNISFAGIQFSYATWLRPGTGEGLSEVQATLSLTGTGAYATQGLCGVVSGGTCPFGAWTKPPGNVSFHHATDIRFDRDAFVHLGGAGLDLGNGAQSTKVIGCVFTDISGNGVQLGDVDQAQTTVSGETTSRDQISDNWFSRLAVEYHGGVAIFVGYASDSTISHNQIDHVPYSGISIGWGGWLDKVSKPAQPNYSHDNLIANNLIFDHMLLLSDGAGVYTNGRTGSSLANGEHITANVIHDQRGPGNAIYTDNGAAYLTITDNVLYHNGSSWGGRHTDTTANDGNYDPEDIEHNYWEGGEPSSSKKAVTLAHNQLIRGSNDAPASIVDAAGLDPAYRDLLATRYASPSTPSSSDKVTATVGNGFAYVSWTTPIPDGNSPISSYTVKSSGGQQATISAADFDRLGYVKLTGLANGTAYTFIVVANNATGSGTPSLPSRPVTPAATTPRKPGVPTNLHLTPGDGTAALFFSPPADDGGSPVVAYTVTASNGTRTTVTGRRTVLLKKQGVAVFHGLTNGTAYTFTVTATTVAGTGASATSGPVTPAPL